MTTAPNVMALIPARGGSKSIPRKNIKLLGGHPLIAYSIAAARTASLVERIVVSTDDPEIARVAKALGADVPFQRPASLAGDAVTDLPVFVHALQALESAENYRPDIVVHLRPTSPLRPHGAVDGAIRLLVNNAGGDSVRSVAPPGQNPYKMWRIRGGRLRPLLPSKVPEAYNAPRQALPETFWQTGQVDVIRRTTIIDKNSMSGHWILPYLVDSAYAVDLDTAAQWVFAEHLVQAHQDDMIMPGEVCPSLTTRVRMVASSFEGVFTDNRVWLTQGCQEIVACSREDAQGISRLQAAGITFAIISSEASPVVYERAKKLKVPCYQRVSRKSEILARLAREQGLRLQDVAYIGADRDDLEVLRAVGLAVAVAEACPEILREASLVLKQGGGRGAIRELCDLILASREKESG